MILLSKTCHRFVGAGLSLALFAVMILFTTSRVVLAQQSSADARGPATTTITASTLPAAKVDQIVRAFAAKETRFRQALNGYAFKRDALGNRFEKINFFPMPTLTEISITAQDLEDLGGVNPFALEANKLDAYSFRYVGKEKIDELDLYVFDVGPKVAPNPKKVKDRFF